MRAVVQRVNKGGVRYEGIDKAIGQGLVILLGVTHGDTAQDAEYLADKCLNLRIFGDDEGKMNRSLLDIQGDMLVISQFTLYGDCRKGRRPSFVDAAAPETANQLYEEFVGICKKGGLKVETGKFAAHMNVLIENDGPVTIILESK